MSVTVINCAGCNSTQKSRFRAHLHGLVQKFHPSSILLFQLYFCGLAQVRWCDLVKQNDRHRLQGSGPNGRVLQQFFEIARVNVTSTPTCATCTIFNLNVCQRWQLDQLSVILTAACVCANQYCNISHTVFRVSISGFKLWTESSRDVQIISTEKKRIYFWFFCIVCLYGSPGFEVSIS